MKQKRINWLKIIALIFMIIEMGIVVWVDKGVVKEQLWVWRWYVACVMMIPINFMFICTKQTKKKRG